MSQKINYQLEMEKVIQTIPKGEKPKLLLQCCCAPCSSAVLEAVVPYFEVYIYNYNPNTYPPAEYEKRLAQFAPLLQGDGFKDKVHIVEAPYHPEEFFNAVQGLEEEPEGGKRCMVCYRVRLEGAAKKAKEIGADYFTTTLSVSPYKNAVALNTIGKALGETYGVPYLPSDFKKKEGYKKSIRLSHAYGLYRQDYCGCKFSMREPTEDK